MRRSDKEARDRAKIQRTLEVAKVLRLGLTDGDYPYIVPLHYGYVYAGDVLHFYMHGVKEGKKFALAVSNPHTFVGLDYEVETTGEDDITCMCGANYTSLTARGKVTVVESPGEKIEGLKLPTRAQTGRDSEITTQQAAGVAVFHFDAENYSVEERKKK